MAIGRPDLVEHKDYDTAEARARNRKALNQEMARSLKTKTSAEWVEIMNKGGVPCGPIYRMDQVFADPQVKHMKIAADVPHKRLGKVRLISQPVRLSRTPAALLTATPERGEHTEEVLRELGLEKNEIEKLKSEGVV